MLAPGGTSAGRTWDRPCPGEPCRWRQQVVVRAGTELEDRDAGGGVRDEHVQEAVAAALDEAAALAGQVVDDLARTGHDGEDGGLHATALPRAGRLPAGKEEDGRERTSSAIQGEA